MPSSDAVRERTARARAAETPARPAGAADPADAGRASRIISAERLSEYTPFAMHTLTREDAGTGAPNAENAAKNAAGAAGAGAARSNAGPIFAQFGAGQPGASAGASGGTSFGASFDAPEPREARAAHDDGRKAGLVEGFRRGFDAGVAHAEAEQRKAEERAGATLAQRVDALCTSLCERLEAVERHAADEIVTLALEVARQALRATLAVRPETIVPVVQEALAHLIDEHVRLHLHLNPDDVALVRAELGERLAGARCSITADPSIERGGCRIDTPRASVDATVQTRWRRTLASLGRKADGSIGGAADGSIARESAPDGQAQP